MADKKISQLTGATTPLAGTEELPIVQGGATTKVSVANLTAGRNVSASNVYVSNGADANAIVGNQIRAYANFYQVGASTGGYVSIHTTPSTVGNLAERLRVDPNGQVGIGTINPGALLEVRSPVGGSGGIIRIANTAGGLTTNSPIGYVDFYNNDTSQDGPQIAASLRGFCANTDGSGGVIALYTAPGNTGSEGAAPIERLRVTSTGNVIISTGNIEIGTSGKGIDFSATPGTGTSELLADYEEGTWTPVDGSGAGLTFSTAVGHYTKIGRMVTVVFNVVYPSTANASAARVGGLPFTSANTANNLSNGCFTINTSAQLAQPSILANATNFAALVTAAGTSATNVNLSLATLSGGLTYFV